ncbi:MAG: carbon storage regulator [Nitrospirae bacterium]|nr:MAG: carbon storage regulator [Nitrospirota bacterium]
MLVLTRRSDESIRLGEDILITVLEIRGNQVRLGIKAPRGVRIFREELYQKTLKENLLAAGIDGEVFDALKEVFKKG